MSLTLSTLLVGLILLGLGFLLLVSNSAITAMFKALPRSQAAAIVFFGAGAAWFTYNVAGMSAADVIGFSSSTPFVFLFAALAVLSFIYLPEFLAVRGLSVVILVGSWPLLMSAYGRYELPQRLCMVSALYVAISAAIYLGASPFRLRDFFEWLFRTPARARALGAALSAYGLLLAGIAFTY
ncbi:MAG: hypothetical protein H2172_08685 [Opitutus sp.]|nr:hypothetical protein [Opitutus sp.]MCS6248156.1 hypothetical protein [Opitutus sp.]MCS6274753.1 hypothetical protein [Opitutus sp.]MCS6276430.1 hypothetical protein [Opitutus sp.]MCS6301922.1 hypothetical protein [Opitutus sp.]